MNIAIAMLGTVVVGALMWRKAGPQAAILTVAGGIAIAIAACAVIVLTVT